MIAPRWKKVLRDLWGNKMRTLLVVLSIAVGVFAVGAVSHTFSIVSQELIVNYPKANPAAATIYPGAFDDTLLDTVRRMPGVQDVEGRSLIIVRLRMGENEWKNFLLFAISDFDDIKINKVKPQGAYDAAPEFHGERGTWPPPDHAVVLERSSLLVPGLVPAGLEVGKNIEVQLSAGGQIRDLKVAGLAKETVFAPAPFVSYSYGYITMDTLEWLTGSRNMDQLMITVSDDKLNKEHITDVANQIKNKLQSGGRTVTFTVPEPGKHPIQDIFNGLLLILNLLGFGALILSGFLVINTITALLAQQVRQIGIMKAIGGRTRQIVGMYLITVLLFGIMALIIAIPSAAYTAGQLSQYLAGFVNVDFPDFSLPTNILIVEIVIGLLIPLFAALFPIFSGTRVSVREAMSDYGLGKGQMKLGITDRLLEKVRGLSRPMMLSFRNTFRRKTRLLLTMLTLILGGTIFMSVLTVRQSMYQTLDDVFKYWAFDVLIPFEHPYRTDVIEEIAKQTPGVTRVESWGMDSSPRRIRADDSESDTLLLFAPPPGTTMVEPTVLEGRWLSPQDENAIVISTDVQRAEKDLKIGDELTLKIQGRETTWQIVGTVRVVGFSAGIGVAYVNYPYYVRAIGQVGRAQSVQVNTTKHDSASQAQIMQALEENYRIVGMRATAGSMTSGQIRDNNEIFFTIISVLLMVMAVLMAAVGGLGLMGTMSLNVLERTREIGVMRAVGASNGAVRNIVLAEGVFIGLLSAMIAALLSFPLSQAFSDLVGNAIFQLPLSYSVSMEGIVAWFIIVTILSALASFLPAFNASRLTVREILAYE
ncbi:MAG: ABC transporter permease [Chloroflexi bacterium]|nr:ABC transporter permease [Chloroflexota bacterium]